MKKYIIAAAMMAVSVAAMANDKQKNDTLVVTTTPVMHCANCENKIKSNIRFVKGTKSIETSVPKQTVTIVYDSRKSSLDAYKAAFRKIGFDIKPVK